MSCPDIMHLIEEAITWIVVPVLGFLAGRWASRP